VKGEKRAGRDLWEFLNASDGAKRLN